MNCLRETNIRPVDRSDLAFLAALRNDYEVAKNLYTYRLLTMSSQESWFSTVSVDTSMQYFIFEILDSEKFVPAGLARITDIDFINRSANVGGDIHRKYRGRKLSKHLYAHIFDMAFNKLNLNRIYLEVFSTNMVAINLYTNLGFFREGHLREAVIRDGKKIDIFIMSMLEGEYRSRYCMIND